MMSFSVPKSIKLVFGMRVITEYSHLVIGDCAHPYTLNRKHWAIFDQYHAIYLGNDTTVFDPECGHGCGNRNKEVWSHHCIAVQTWLADCYQCIICKLVMTIYNCLNGLVPSHQANDCMLVSSVASRRHLRSADTQKLVSQGTRIKCECERCRCLDGSCLKLSARSKWRMWCLCMQEMKMACARCVEDLGLLNLLVRLLDATQQCLSAANGASMPKYLRFFSLPFSFQWPAVLCS